MGGAVFSRKGHPDSALGSEKKKPAQTRGPGTSALRRRPSSTQAQGPARLRFGVEVSGLESFWLTQMLLLLTFYQDV